MAVMSKYRRDSLLRLGFLCLILVLVHSRAAIGEQLTLRVCAYKGYTEPFVDSFKKRIKEKYNFDIDFKIAHVVKPDDAYLAALNRDADLITISHNMYKSDETPFLEKQLIHPIDCKKLENFSFVLPVFMKEEFVGENGMIYGIPLAVGFYALAYNTEKVSEEPTSWNVLWNDEYKNSYSISSDYYECNVFVTALASGVPPDSLYDAQKIFDNVSIRVLRDKLNELAKNAYSLWEDEASVDEMKNLALITTWGFPVILANQQGQKWKFAKPKEGLTAWLDFWSISNAVDAGSKKYQICLDWIDYCLSPDVQKKAIQEWGNTPVVGNINDLFSPEEIEGFKIGNSDYWKTVSFWGIINKESIRIEQALWRYALAQRDSRDRMQEYIDNVDKAVASERSDSLELGKNSAMGQSPSSMSGETALDRTDITISIPDFLLQRLRVVSIKKRSKIDAVVEQAVREYLERNSEIPKSPKK